MTTQTQWIRRIQLVVFTGAVDTPAFSGIDLSAFRIRFQINTADVDSPDNAVIRIYNLAPSTLGQITNNLTSVILQAGYENGAFGTIFKGDIIQFKKGKDSPTSTYLDIMAANGDAIYGGRGPANGGTQGHISASVPAGTNNAEQLSTISQQLGVQVDISAVPQSIATGGVLPRGKVLFGLARAPLRMLAQKLDSNWSINNSVVTVRPYNAVLPTEPVVLSYATGVIGMPEQTNEGIKVKCLLNPLLQIGGNAKIANNEINQTFWAGKKSSPTAATPFAGVPYNQWAGLTLLANVGAGDGTYRILAIEHEGDIRGQEWYSNLILLSTDATVTVSGAGVVASPDNG